MWEITYFDNRGVHVIATDCVPRRFLGWIQILRPGIMTWIPEKMILSEPRLT